MNSVGTQPVEADDGPVLHAISHDAWERNLPALDPSLPSVDDFLRPGREHDVHVHANHALPGFNVIRANFPVATASHELVDQIDFSARLLALIESVVVVPGKLRNQELKRVLRTVLLRQEIGERYVQFGAVGADEVHCRHVRAVRRLKRYQPAEKRRFLPLLLVMVVHHELRFWSQVLTSGLNELLVDTRNHGFSLSVCLMRIVYISFCIRNPKKILHQFTILSNTKIFAQLQEYLLVCGPDRNLSFEIFNLVRLKISGHQIVDKLC